MRTEAIHAAVVNGALFGGAGLAYSISYGTPATTALAFGVVLVATTIPLALAFALFASLLLPMEVADGG
jgi:hypothetical protein